MQYRLVILTTQINPDVVKAMLTSADAEIKKQQAVTVDTIKTVGCFDMPLIAQHILARDDVDGLVLLGALAQGDTKHDELAANTMTNSIMSLSLKHDKPVGFGVIGPGARKEDFMPRADEYARRAVEAVIENLKILRNQ